MDYEGKTIAFHKTSFYKGTSATYGKLPIRLELCLDVCVCGEESLVDHLLSVGLFVGEGNPHRVNDMAQFLEDWREGRPYRFHKNFIWEPEKMCFQKSDAKLLDSLSHIMARRSEKRAPWDGKGEASSKGTILGEEECESFLDGVGEAWDAVSWRETSQRIGLSNELDITVRIEKSGLSNCMYVDYSRYMDFEPLTISFSYLYCKEQRLIVKVAEEERELIGNLYRYKTQDGKVCFTLARDDMRFFQRNFLERYSGRLNLSVDKAVKKELKESQLLAKAYFDVASNGIVAKLEFCYGDKCTNPLDDAGTDKAFRELDRETKALSALKAFGFQAYGRLFLLDDAEKIMHLLTDPLAELKKAAQVYYSVDFKKLHVKNLNQFGFSLSEDASLIQMDINLENVSDEELMELLWSIQRGKKYYRLRSGSIVNLSSVESGRLVALIRSLELNKGDVRGGLFEIPLNRCEYINRYLQEKEVKGVTIDSRLGCLMKRVAHPEEVELKLPDQWDGVLREYQKEGVKWLQTMSEYSFGGILADEMGLGKTLQVLVFLALEAGKEGGACKRRPPSVVIAPTSVIYNWAAEAERYTPLLKVLVIVGTKDKRDRLIEQCKNYDLLVTSYSALKNDVESYQSHRFSYVFLDEAQNIKNPMTLNANAVKGLRAQSAFALSGTPIENRLMELWSIFDFVMPGFLPEQRKFKLNYEEPIARERDRGKTEELANLIKPFVLRRKKKDVLSELPEKVETNYLAQMSEEQKKLYAAFYKEFANEWIPKWKEEGMGKNRMELLAALTRLRQICAHPGTFLEGYNGGSGKLDLAMEIIVKSVGSGHSVLLFSQFTKLLAILRRELERKQIRHYYLDGKMKPEDRLEEVDDFNHDREAVFLISLKAGGTGLNLTKADVVIQFDPWWNPAVESQASDRAHRIGQTNMVQVCNLLTEGTIEVGMERLKARKKDLMEHLIESGGDFLERLCEGAL